MNTYRRICIGIMLACLLALAAAILYDDEPDDCITDSDCAAMFGGNGSPQ